MSGGSQETAQLIQDIDVLLRNSALQSTLNYHLVGQDIIFPTHGDTNSSPPMLHPVQINDLNATMNALIGKVDSLIALNGNNAKPSRSTGGDRVIFPEVFKGGQNEA